MYQLQYKTQFKKDLKRIKRRSNSDFELTKTFIKLLQEGGINNVPAHNKPHALIGNYKGHYEAHIKPDLLII